MVTLFFYFYQMERRYQLPQIQGPQGQEEEMDPRRLSTYPKDMKMLGGVVLNKKKDIKFSRNAAHPEGAERMAQRKGWTCQVDDINNDHVDDIVLFDKRGHPVYINGYSLKPSEHMIRKEYFAHPINERVAGGGYKAYKKAMRDDVDFRTGQQEWLAGYAKILPAPRRRPNANPAGSVYQRFTARMKAAIDGYIARTYIDPPRVNVMKKVIPWPSVLAYFYLNIILNGLWRNESFRREKAVIRKTTNPSTRCEMFKKVLTKNAAIVEHELNDATLDAIVADYTDENIADLLDSIDINHDDIYAEDTLPTDTDDLTPEFKGAIAFDKERISNSILQSKERCIHGIFSE